MIIPFFLIMCFAGCSNLETQIINDDQNFKDYIPSDSRHQFFPFDSVHLISNDREVDSSIKQMYSEILFHLQEPSLYEDKNDKIKCIRILWLNARRPPKVIRVNDINGSKYLVKKEFDNSYNGSTGHIIDTTISIDKYFWQTISLSLDSSNFWKERIGNPTSSGKDGILWVLECRLQERYYFIERWDDGTLSSISQYPFLKTMLNAGNILK